jgi:outer membrane protein TolC
MFVAALAAGCRAATALAAQQPDAELAALVREALERSPELKAAEQALAAARNRPAQAQALPNPALGLSYTNDGWPLSLGKSEMSTLALTWSQELPYPGKRSLRAEQASLEACAVEQQLARARLTVAASVKRAYFALLLARQQLELLREQEAAWAQIEEVARARDSVGQGAQQDVLRVQVEVIRLEQLRIELETERGIRLAELNRLTARAAETPLETAARLELQPVPGGLESWLAQLTPVSPELKAAQLAVERDRVSVALAHKDFKPDFGVQAAYMSRRELDPMWQAGVTVSLPLRRKREGAALAEAEARLAESERRVEAVRLQLRFRTEERLAQIRAAERIAALYEKGVVPQGQMSVQAAVASYQAGRVPFISVLEALATLYGDRTTELRSLAELAGARASLEEASLDAAPGLGSIEQTRMGAARSTSAGAQRSTSGGMGSMGSR